jgi:hypothetical protein
MKLKKEIIGVALALTMIGLSQSAEVSTSNLEQKETIREQAGEVLQQNIFDIRHRRDGRREDDEDKKLHLPLNLIAETYRGGDRREDDHKEKNT